MTNLNPRKMKLQGAIGDLQTEIEIQDRSSQVSVLIDGRSYDLEVRESAEGSFIIRWDGRVFVCRLEGSIESGAPTDVFVRTVRRAVTITDPKRLRGASAAGLHAGAAARLIAPMPGKVVRLLAQVGDQVAAGDGIIVVEAMKMQNEIKTPKAGAVTAINVEINSTVNSGAVLAIVE